MRLQLLKKIFPFVKFFKKREQSGLILSLRKTSDYLVIERPSMHISSLLLLDMNLSMEHC